MKLIVNEENNRICWNLFCIKWHFWPEKVFFSMVEPIENVKLLWHCILIFHSSVQLFRIDWIELALDGAIWNTFLLSFPASDTTTVCVVCYCQCYFFNTQLQHSYCSILTGLRLHLVEQYGTGRVAEWWHNTIHIIYHGDTLPCIIYHGDTMPCIHAPYTIYIHTPWWHNIKWWQAGGTISNIASQSQRHCHSIFPPNKSPASAII